MADQCFNLISFIGNESVKTQVKMWKTELHHTHLIVIGERFDVTVAICHKDYPEHLCIKAFLGTSENVDSARAPLKTFGLY